MSKYKIRNAHCTYYEGQTGLCKAKEFVKCNPVNCKLYTIDELSTIVDLQEQLKRKEQEYERLNEYSVGFARKCQKLELDVCHLKDKNYNLQRRLYQLKQTLAEIKEIAEPFCNACQEFEPEKSKNCINCTYCNYNKILQKISECEVKHG